MDISRRGFLGSLLGTYVATQAPWIARLPDFVEPSDTLVPYRLLLVLADGTEIKGPAIKDVETDVLLHTYRFIAESIECRRQFTAIGSVLLGPNGEPLYRGNWASARTLCPGDVLRASHNITAITVAESPSDFIYGPRINFATKTAEPRLIKRRNIIRPR